MPKEYVLKQEDYVIFFKKAKVKKNAKALKKQDATLPLGSYLCF